jgi:hypothetical protein
LVGDIFEPFCFANLPPQVFFLAFPIFEALPVADVSARVASGSTLGFSHYVPAFRYCRAGLFTQKTALRPKGLPTFR